MLFNLIKPLMVDNMLQNHAQYLCNVTTSLSNIFTILALLVDAPVDKTKKKAAETHYLPD